LSWRLLRNCCGYGVGKLTSLALFILFGRILS
jgi:hypothetical protein